MTSLQRVIMAERKATLSEEAVIVCVFSAVLPTRRSQEISCTSKLYCLIVKHIGSETKLLG